MRSEPRASDAGSASAREFSADGFAALSLRERVAIVRDVPGGRASVPSDEALAERRLARWRSEPAFAADPDLLRERVGDEGLSLDEFRHLLGVVRCEGADPSRFLGSSWHAI